MVLVRERRGKRERRESGREEEGEVRGGKGGMKGVTPSKNNILS